MTPSSPRDRFQVDDVVDIERPTPSPEPLAGGDSGPVPVRIQPMGPSDLAQVQEIEDEAFGKTAWSAAQWSEELAQSGEHERRCYVVLQTVDEPCRTLGYAGVWDTGGDADILTLAVGSQGRGQGWGAALLQHLVEQAHQWRCRALLLEVAQTNEAASSLYKSFGFDVLATRRHYYGPDRHALTMRRQLRLPMGSQPFGGDPEPSEGAHGEA